jgi:hypothetical protein
MKLMNSLSELKMKLKISVGKRIDGCYQRLWGKAEEDGTADAKENGATVSKGKKDKILDSGLETTQPKVWVSSKLLAILSAIQDKAERNEFSVLLKGVWGPAGFVVRDDYVIPKQEVSGTSVDYKEPLAPYMENYNVVLHSHPFSQTSSFSGSDEATININFDCSLLYTGDRKISEAVLNVQVPGGALLQLKAEIFEYAPKPVVTVSGLENIESKWTRQSTGNYIGGSYIGGTYNQRVDRDINDVYGRLDQYL